MAGKEYDYLIKGDDIASLLLALSLMREGKQICWAKGAPLLPLPLFLPSFELDSPWRDLFDYLLLTRSEKLLFSTVSPAVQFALPGRVIDCTAQILRREEDLLLPLLRRAVGYFGEEEDLEPPKTEKNLIHWLADQAMIFSQGSIGWHRYLLEQLRRGGALILNEDEITSFEKKDGSSSAQKVIGAFGTQGKPVGWIESAVFEVSRIALPPNMAHLVLSLLDADEPLINKNLLLLIRPLLLPSDPSPQKLPLTLARYLSDQPIGKPEGLFGLLREHFPYLFTSLSSLPDRTTFVPIWKSEKRSPLQLRSPHLDLSLSAPQYPLPSPEIPLQVMEWAKALARRSC